MILCVITALLADQNIRVRGYGLRAFEVLLFPLGLEPASILIDDTRLEVSHYRATDRCDWTIDGDGAADSVEAFLAEPK